MKKSTKTIVIVVSSIAAVVAIGVVALAIAVTSYLTTTGNQENDREAAVQQLADAQKNFSKGETAEIGPYDVKVVAVKANYTPQGEEKVTAEKVLSKPYNVTRGDFYGSSLTGSRGQYVQLTLNITYNPARSSYTTIALNDTSWMDQFGELRLNDHMRVLAATPDVKDISTMRQMETTAKTAEGQTLTLLYRIPSTQKPTEAYYKISIFTKTSAFVGTEGMPRAEYKFTIDL